MRVGTHTISKARLVPKLGGPYFDFLVVAPDEYRERTRPNRKATRIKPEYFHHPEALRVSDCVVGVAVDCFLRAHSHFDYHGETEFGGESLERLITELSAQVEVIQACKWKREFGALVTDLFSYDCAQSVGPWQRHWPRIREEVAEAISNIVERANTAVRDDKVLLVIGV